MTNSSVDLSFTPDNELVELVWENGQILMQSQTSRTRKSPSHASFSSLITSKAQEKDNRDDVAPEIGRLGTVDSVLNGFSLSGPSSHIGLCEEYDMFPWLNYPLDDTLQHDLSSEFFPELTGASLSALSSQNNALRIDKNSSSSQLVSDTDLVSVHGDANPEQRNSYKVLGGGLEPPAKPRVSQLCSSPLQQFQASVPSFTSRDSDFISCNTNNYHQAPCRISIQNPASTGGRPNMKVQKLGMGSTRPPRQPSNYMGLMNLSHFSRATALVKTNLQGSNSGVNPCISNIDKLKSNGKVSASVSSNPVESMLIEPTSGSTSVAAFQSHPVRTSGKEDLKPSIDKPPKEPLTSEKPGAVCQEDDLRNTGLQDQAFGQTLSFAGNTAMERPECEKDVEPVVASSSVCSGNNAGGASNDPKLTLKRKSQDAEESEYQSEFEEESVGARKPTTTRGGMGARRNRAAEVHNLSERRRRDRINEKMRALQELIPNCNKVDKASMLDEAIEYLKSLQLQVQIMSMGAGFYMPPLMLPSGMHAPHFSSMGVGMGVGMSMGVSFGMGMYDLSANCPLIQVPPMHGVQFPCPPISASLPMMAGCSPQMLRFPRQGPPMSMSHAPYIPLSEGPSIKSDLVHDISRTAPLVEVPDSALSSCSKYPIKNTNLQMMPEISDKYSQNQMPSQGKIDSFEQYAIAQRNNETPHVSGNRNIKSTNGNETD